MASVKWLSNVRPTSLGNVKLQVNVYYKLRHFVIGDYMTRIRLTFAYIRPTTSRFRHFVTSDQKTPHLRLFT